MAYLSSKIGKATLKSQTNHATMDVSTGTTFECEVDLSGISREVFQRASIRGGWHALNPIVGGYAQSVISAKWMMHGWRSSTPSGDPTAHADAMIIEAVLGSSVQSGYQAAAQVASGSDENTIKIAAAKDETLYKAGGAAIFTAAASASYALGVVKTSTDGGGGDHTVELLVPIPFVVGDGLVTYGCNSIWQGLTQPTFYTFGFQGESDEMLIHLGGICPTSVKLEMTPGGLIMVEAQLSASQLSVTTGTGVTPYSYTTPTIPALIGEEGCRLVEDNGTTTPTTVDVQSFTCEMTQDLAVIRGAGANGGVRTRHAGNRRQRLTMQKIVDDAPDFSLGYNDAKVALLLAAGDAPGNMFGLCMPKPTQMEVAKLGDGDGVWAQTYMYDPGIVTGDSPSSDGPANSPFRIYFG